MCNFAETKNRQLCPMPYVCICVYYAIYFLCSMSYSQLPSLLHSPYAIFPIP